VVAAASALAASGGREVTAPAPAPKHERGTREKVVDVVTRTARSPWFLLAVLLAAAGYLLGQRMLDGGGKLAHAGSRPGDPDDELIDL
jgi:hypothetical protein